jgi:hypothetical protein
MLRQLDVVACTAAAVQAEHRRVVARLRTAAMGKVKRYLFAHSFATTLLL